MATDPLPEHDAPQTPPEHTTGVQLARRRLLRGSLGAAPVLLAVSSRPVLATGSGGGTCTPASSFASINASRPGGKADCVCSGYKPGTWKDKGDSVWPSGCGPTKKFDDCFGSTGGYGTKSLRDVLRISNPTEKDTVAQHCVAAYLNVLKGFTPSQVMDLNRVKQVWNDYRARGWHEPTAGVRWYAAYATPSGNGGIKPWFSSTMPY